LVLGKTVIGWVLKAVSYKPTSLTKECGAYGFAVKTTAPLRREAEESMTNAVRACSGELFRARREMLH
jgi:hypothetical protein